MQSRPRRLKVLRKILLALGLSLFCAAAVFAQAGGYVGRIVTNAAAGTTGAVTATLAAIAGKTIYLCGFDVSAIGTGAVGPITVTGLLGGTFTYQLVAVAGGVTLPKAYTPCIPAASPTTAIAIVTTADASASAVNVHAWASRNKQGVRVRRRLQVPA